MSVTAQRHVLDRPIWECLSTLQKPFASGSELALRFAEEIGPLAAARDDNAESLAHLADLAHATRPDEALILLQSGASPVPPSCTIDQVMPAVQMVAVNLKPVPSNGSIETLSSADAAEMVALAALTQPGPFRIRTHKLGTFCGIRIDGQLVAMAGERMKLDGYTEVSGVCTHPDFRGRGYAAALSSFIAERIMDRGEVPFLHARASNTGAISLYEALGFRLRRAMTVTMLRGLVDPDTAAMARNA